MFKGQSDLKDQLIQSCHLQLKTASLEADAYSIADVDPGGAPDLHNSFSLCFPQAISQDESCGWSFLPGLCRRAMLADMKNWRARHWEAVRTLDSTDPLSCALAASFKESTQDPLYNSWSFLWSYL